MSLSHYILLIKISYKSNVCKFQFSIENIANQIKSEYDREKAPNEINKKCLVFHKR